MLQCIYEYVTVRVSESSFWVVGSSEDIVAKVKQVHKYIQKHMYKRCGMYTICNTTTVQPADILYFRPHTLHTF